MNSKMARQLAELAPKIMSAFHDLGRQHPSDEKLSMRQFQALIILHADEKLSLTQLCEKLSLAPSTGTELVNRMISLGFVEKVGEESDRRQVLLKMTPKGIELLQQRREALSEMFRKFLEPFPPKEQEEFVRSFERIWELIRTYHFK